jgi:Mlc titration factor MtfA (ptsG expression regulator)
MGRPAVALMPAGVSPAGGYGLRSATLLIDLGPMFSWLRSRRRRKILEQPFPSSWRDILLERFGAYHSLGDEERQRLEQMVQVFLAEKRFEGLGGLEITDEVRVLIAAQACMLILGLSHDLYRKVESILVYPSTVVRPESLFGERRPDGELASSEMPLLGEAHLGGPVILAWDAVAHGAVHPDDGLNVVYHEFAHKLDMLDGEADGVPPLGSKAQYRTWAEVCRREYNFLIRRTDRGLESFLDDYGATHPAEFFAVATELFFEKAEEMKRRRPKLYEVLQGFYNQDPAARTDRASP